MSVMVAAATATVIVVMVVVVLATMSGYVEGRSRGGSRDSSGGGSGGGGSDDGGGRIREPRKGKRALVALARSCTGGKETVTMVTHISTYRDVDASVPCTLPALTP